MRGTVVKALRTEAQYQDVPLKKLKRNFMKLNHKERGGMRARLAVYAAMRESETVMYILEKIESKGGEWWEVRIVGPNGNVIKYLQWGQDEEQIRKGADDKVAAMNENYFDHRKKKAGWMKQRDEGTNQVYSDKGYANREKKRKQVYREKLKAHFNERKLAKEAGRL